MIRLRVVTALALAVAAPAHGSAAGDRQVPVSPQSRLEESVLVQRAHWPVLIRPLPGFGEVAELCATLGPGDVEVVQDGKPLAVTAVGRRPLPRTHVLLIDTSRSMVRDRLERGTLLDEAKRAATVYVDAVPDDDALMVASFDESLVLHAPPLRRREPARRVIRELEAGLATALWDALYYLVLYAETLPGEKIIVLLTDGEDSSSLKEHSFERVLELAAGAPNLSVFPIGVDLPRSVQRGVPTARGRLGELARQTGGEFFDIRHAHDLDRVFQRARQRLDDRSYVSYVPDPTSPSGESGPSARPRAGSRLKIRLRQGLPCRLVPLGLPGRHERRAPGASADLERLELSPEEIGALLPAATGLVSPASPTIDGALRLRGAGKTEGQPNSDSRLFTLRGREALLGAARDLLVERGPLFRLGPYLREGKLRTDSARRPQFGTRTIAVVTPPLEQLRGRLTGPEELLLQMLDRELPAPPRSDRATPVRAPFIVHGQTFLELRELIGRTLFDAYPDYRAWALGRVERGVDADLRALLARSPEVGSLSPELRDELRRALLLRAGDPAEGRPHLPLVEWIADVSARETAIELERRLADELLRGAGDPGRDLERAERLAEAWWRVGRWFPPAVDSRILAPLIPAYDPRRDVVGFYRFLLPWPEWLGPRTAPLPSRPLGLLTALRLVRQGDGGLPRPGSSGVLALEYAAVGRREWLDAGCPGDRELARGAEKVVLVLAGEPPAERDHPLRLNVYYLPGTAPGEEEPAPVRPACWRVEIDADAPPGLAGLARAIGGVLGPEGGPD